MDNPFLDRRRGRADGRAEERKASKRLGGRVHAGSGAMSEKADMTVGDFKVEVKATTKDSMRLPAEWLVKVKQEALEVGKRPALLVQFSAWGEAWVAVPESVFKELIE